MSILGLCLVGTISHIPPMYTLSRAILLIFFDPIILSLSSNFLPLDLSHRSLYPQPSTLSLFHRTLSLSLSICNSLTDLDGEEDDDGWW